MTIDILLLFIIVNTSIMVSSDVIHAKLDEDIENINATSVKDRPILQKILIMLFIPPKKVVMQITHILTITLLLSISIISFGIILIRNPKLIAYIHVTISMITFMLIGLPVFITMALISTSIILLSVLLDTK